MYSCQQYVLIASSHKLFGWNMKSTCASATLASTEYMFQMSPGELDGGFRGILGWLGGELLGNFLGGGATIAANSWHG